MTKAPAWWTLRCRVTRVVDADTVEVEAEVMPGTKVTHMVRLYGIECPPATTEAGRAATAALDGLVRLAPSATLLLRKAPDKYGRWLAEIVVDGANATTYLLTHGHGVPYYGGPKPLQG